MINIFKLKNSDFVVLIALILFINGLVFLPKYGAWNGPTDTEYQTIAQNIYRGEGFSLNGEKTMFREPLYPFLVFLNYKVFGENNWPVRIEQLVFLFFIIYLAYKISLESFGEKTAKITAITISFIPIFLIYVTDVGSEIVSATLALLAVYFFFKKPAWSGLFCGLFVLTKSIFIFLPLFLIIIYFFEKRSKSTFIFLAIFFLAITPWIYRNYSNFGKLSIADRGGMVFYLHALKGQFSKEQLNDYSVSALWGGYFTKLKNPNYDIAENEGILTMNKRREMLLRQGRSSSEADAIMLGEGKKMFLDNKTKNLFVGFLELVKLNSPMVPRESIMFTFLGSKNSTFLEKIIKGGILITFRIVWLAALLLCFLGGYRSIKNKNKRAVVMIFFIIYLNVIIFFLQGVPRFAFPLYSFYFTLFAFGVNYLLDRRGTFKT